VTDCSPETLKRNVLKAYNTAQLLIRQALKLQNEMTYLSYAPHFVCRSLLTAATITLSVLLSEHMRDVPLHSKQFTMQEAISAIRMCSIHEGDLPSRASNMIERYWSLNQMLPPLDIPIKEVRNYSNRLGTSLAFDCLRRWKRDIERNRPQPNPVKRQPDGTPGQCSCHGAPSHPRTVGHWLLTRVYPRRADQSRSHPARDCAAH